MQPSVISLFCDDIRQEKRETDIIIGIYPDNVNVPKAPFVFPKIAIYTRIHFDPTTEPSVSIFLRDAEGGEQLLSNIEPELIKKAGAEALVKSGPLAGLISRAVFVNFKMEKAGRILVIAKIDDQEFVGGALNVQLLESERSSSSTEPERPSEQSRDASQAT